MYGTNVYCLAPETKWCKTRLPSNLRLTTRKCIHLVTRGHFRSRDKDGGHTIRSAISENPMLHANFMSLSFIEPDCCCRSKFYIAGIGIFDLFCSCDLDLDPITFIYELDLRYTGCAKINFLRQGFRQLSSDSQPDKQTDRHDRNYIPRRFAGGQKQHSCAWVATEPVTSESHFCTNQSLHISNAERWGSHDQRICVYLCSLAL